MEENQEVFLSMKNEIEKQSQREVDAIMVEVKKMEEEAILLCVLKLRKMQI